MTGDAIVVVPCFNEAERLDLRRFEQLTRSSEVRLLFVDDGSTDRTRSLLESLAARSDGAVEVLARDVNAGKAEAVRAGLLCAMERPRVAYVAYYDADLAAPPCELARVLDTLRGSADVDVAIGSRVAMLGRRIDRSRWRHYQGRIFATAASVVLQAPIYDTQCGLKALRVTPALRAALEAPFRSRWGFDVELLCRLMRSPHPTSGRVIEVPLNEWRDVGGSRLSTSARVRALAELIVLGWRARSAGHDSGPQMAKNSSSSTGGRPRQTWSPMSSTEVPGGAEEAG